MNIQRYIENATAREEFFNELRGQPFPYCVSVFDPLIKNFNWVQLNAFFHASIVTLFSDVTGYDKKEAKSVLQTFHALVVETPTEYWVESVAHMTYTRLFKFVMDCHIMLQKEFGVVATVNKEVKTKIIKK